jgi:hypothetical protein
MYKYHATCRLLVHARTCSIVDIKDGLSMWLIKNFGIVVNVTKKMSSRKNPPGAKPINRQSMNPHHDSFSDNSSNDDSEMKKIPASINKKRKVREDASNSSFKKQKALQKDDIIILTSPKGSKHGAITAPNDFSMSNIP